MKPIDGVEPSRNKAHAAESEIPLGIWDVSVRDALKRRGSGACFVLLHTWLPDMYVSALAPALQFFSSLALCRVSDATRDDPKYTGKPGFVAHVHVVL